MVEQKYQPTAVARELLELAVRDGTPLTPMKLLKLVYLCDAWHLGYYGRSLLNEAPEAWRYGSVIPSLYQRFKCYGSNQINPSEGKRLPKADFDPDAESIIDGVWNAYVDFGGLELSSLTHRRGTPWWKAWHEYGGSTEKGIPIDKLDTLRYYERKLQHGSGK